MQPDDTAKTSTITNQKLANLPIEETKCYIYRVYDQLRNMNLAAYEPQILAIGPYHNGKDNSKLMEKHKWLYLKSLLQRKNQSVDTYVWAIEQIERKARSCYADHINLSSAEFTEMLLVDGCFIIELLRKAEEANRRHDDPIFETKWMITSMQRDLMLFENQIPFFVLCKLFNLVEGSDANYQTLLNRIFLFFKRMIPGAQCRMRTNADDIKHLLHLIHIFWSPDSLDTSGQKTGYATPWQFVNSATKFRDANVKFEKNLQEASLFDITFKNGTLKLSNLPIEDGTEALFRNLIAYEQYFPKREQLNFATDYVIFLDTLIDSPGDVEILRQHGILQNFLGSDEVVSNIFNKLSNSVTIRHKFIYAGVLHDMNKHYKKRRNKWMAMLRRNQLRSPWAILSLIAGFVLLLLTAVQAVCSVLQIRTSRN